MPFTFAHPAAVLPGFRMLRGNAWRYSLVAGSLAPDLLRGLPSLGRELTHSWLGVLFLVVPTASFLAWAAVLWLHPRLRRLPGLPSADKSNPSGPWWSYPLGAWFGGATHLVWDMATHDQSPLTRGGILDLQLFQTPAGPFMLGQTIWFASSFLGVVACLWWVCAWISRGPQGWAGLRSGSWLRLFLAPLLPFAWILVQFEPHTDSPVKELFFHIFYLSGDLAPLLLGPSAILVVVVFLWETRTFPRSGIGDRHSGEAG